MKAFSALKNGITSTASAIATTGLNAVAGTQSTNASDTSHSSTGLSDSIKDLLRVSGMIHYLGMVESSDSRIAIEIYENEKWQPILKSWGNILGVHTNAFDRSPFTDQHGHHPLK